MIIMGLTIELDDTATSIMESARFLIGRQQNFNSMPLTNTPIDCLLIAYDQAKSAQKNAQIVESLFEDKDVERTKLKNQEPLLFDKFFPKGEVILLAAEAGCGKSFLSVEIAKSPKIEKALFLTIEDYSQSQMPRYLMNLDNDRFEIIGYKKWRHLFDLMKRSFQQQVNFQIMVQTMTPITYRQMNERKTRLFEKYGIQDPLFLDNLLVFENLMESIKGMNFDFLCIDSLNALFGHASKIGRRTMERLMDIPSQYGITLLLIHHLNKDGEIAGSREIVNVVDTAYVLRRKSQNPATHETELLLEEIKTRHKTTSLERATIIRKNTEDGKVEHMYKETEQVMEEKTATAPLQEAILEALVNSDSGVLSKSELNELLQMDNFSLGNSVANALKTLETRGKVKKGNDKNWDLIILKRDNTN